MTTQPVPRWKLERYILGELTRRDMAAVGRRIRECPETARAVEELRRSDTEFRRRFPAEEIVPRILEAEVRERKGEAAPSPVRRSVLRTLLPAAPVLAAAAVFLLVVILRESPETRIKGGEPAASDRARIEVYRKAGASVETLKDGDAVRAGDLLQIAYLPFGKPFGVVASLDGRGVVTLHYPDTERDSARLKAGRRVRLATSYELDDAPAFECFYFITSPADIDVREVLDRISAAAKDRPDSPDRQIDLPSGWDLFAVCFRKGRLP